MLCVVFPRYYCRLCQLTFVVQIVCMLHTKERSGVPRTHTNCMLCELPWNFLLFYIFLYKAALQESSVSCLTWESTLI